MPVGEFHEALPVGSETITPPPQIPYTCVALMLLEIAFLLQVRLIYIYDITLSA